MPRRGELTFIEAPVEESGCFVDVGGPEATSSEGARSAATNGVELVEATGRGGDNRDGEAGVVEAELGDEDGAIEHKRSR